MPVFQTGYASSILVTHFYAPIAQLVEHQTFNLGVVGSTPTWGTICAISLIGKAPDS